VRLREILSSEAFTTAQGGLVFALGKDVAGAPLVADLERMPHLLVAGATGAGKSVFINCLLISLLSQYGPAALKLILVDPKRVELPFYNGIPHLLSPVITQPEKVVNALRWAVAEMDRRYELLSVAHKRDLASYNQGRRAEDLLPRIVIVIDELADIMARHPREMEDTVVRLAQIARAVGIHLVLATQRPSVDVITGLIKANITSRAAFKVASAVDARTILDASGSEKLLGSGDMLFLASDHTKPRRIQGAYVSEEEVKRVVAFLARTSGEASYDESVTALQDNREIPVNGEDDTVDDELFSQAKQVVLDARRASTSLLQRRLRIGYARAARIMDMLEERGIIGPPDGARPREVLVERERPVLSPTDASASAEPPDEPVNDGGPWSAS
jgi:S-DNA-T family DNA segregation ATPase FtsK/SpoIIIE